MRKSVITVNEEVVYPNGFTMSDNRIEDCLQRFLTPTEYSVWRQYLRYWGGDKKTAYPSLALLSERTGLSEKTIRKANKELVVKGFIRYNSGGPNRSNTYYYIPIETILENYSVDVPAEFPLASPQDSGTEPAEFPPIIQHNKEQHNSKKKKKGIKVTDLSVQAQDFIKVFIQAYENRFHMPYQLSSSDKRAIQANEKYIHDYSIAVKDCSSIYFTIRNKFIESSDYSITFFLSPKVQQSVLAVYNQSDQRRWEVAAEKLFEDYIEPEILGGKINLGKQTTSQYILSKVHLGGGNSTRNNFVLQYLIDKVRKYTDG